MKSKLLTLISCLILPFIFGNPGFCQHPPVVLSSYYNAADPRDEWTEILVIDDNLDLNGWTIRDNNSSQSLWQPEVTFSNALFWNHIRHGTIILLWHRYYGSSGAAHTAEVNKKDGYIEVSADDPVYFSGGSFGSSPGFSGPTLNIETGGDLVQLRDASGTHVHAIGHQLNPGINWIALPLPKLNLKKSITEGQDVIVCPGSVVEEYGTYAPQNGTAFMDASSNPSPGKANNCINGQGDNMLFWIRTRQEPVNPPELRATINSTNTRVYLEWDPVQDNYPQDSTIGYMISRSPHFDASTIIQGRTYYYRDRLIPGSDSVIGLIPNSQAGCYTDTNTIPCGTSYSYRLFTYHFNTDDLNGNMYNQARGRAYCYQNCIFAYITIFAINPVAPTSVSANRDNFCSNDTGTITLTATGGKGTLLTWYSDSCGGIFVDSTHVDHITIPSPAETTTYFVRWESVCGQSQCTPVTVHVLPETQSSVVVSVDENPVCTGKPVHFTAHVLDAGNVPHFAWKVNGISAGADDSLFTYIPSDGDEVHVEMQPDAQCPATTPVISGSVTMMVNSTIPLTTQLSILPDDTVCQGTAVHLTANPNNGGSAPQYQWFLNGISTGSTSKNYTLIPSDADQIWCRVTSNSDCAVNSPSNSDSVTLHTLVPVEVAVSISADRDSICSGTLVNFQAQPVNEGSDPRLIWKVNGILVQDSSRYFSSADLLAGDLVECILISSLGCVMNDTAFSLPVQMKPAKLPVIDLTEKPFLCAGNPVILDAGEGYSVYLWQDGSSGRYLTAADVGIYHVTVSDSLGCSGSDTVELKVCDTFITAPDAFTPNADGKNDVFRIISAEKEILEFSLMIYDRWGATIFESKDLSIGWDGKQNGTDAPQGTYVWTVGIKLPSGDSQSLKGTIVLLR